VAWAREPLCFAAPHGNGVDTMTVNRFERSLEGVPRDVLERRLVAAEQRLAHFEASKGLPGLGWDCAHCGAFNGSMKEDLKACRCCTKERP
jgi:hypothetical protein